jgi:hypothetical protein
LVDRLSVCVSDLSVQADDIDWHTTVDERAIAELAKEVVAPAFDTAVLHDRAGMAKTGLDVFYSTRKAHDVHGYATTGSIAIAELSVPAGAPALDAPFSGEGAREATAHSNRVDRW